MPTSWSVNGLPAHVLLVHAVVVLLPLTSLAAVLVSVWPAAQRKLTFLVPAGAVAGVALVALTSAAGSAFAAQLGDPLFLTRHRALAGMVLPWAAALAVTTTVQWLWFRAGPGDRPRSRAAPATARAALAALVVAAAVGTTVFVALAGEAGAQAVWGGR